MTEVKGADRRIILSSFPRPQCILATRMNTSRKSHRSRSDALRLRTRRHVRHSECAVWYRRPIRVSPPAVNPLRRTVMQARMPVLIMGETGCGKSSLVTCMCEVLGWSLEVSCHSNRARSTHRDWMFLWAAHHIT